MRIEKLTPEQRARLPEFAEKWASIGLCTEEIDKKSAESAIQLMYRQAHMEAPQIIWCQSPLGNALARCVWGKKVGVGQSVWYSVGQSVRDSVWSSVGACVYGQHDAHWLGFYDYFSQCLGLKEQTAPLSGLWQLAQSSGWALCYKEICFVSNRHCAVLRNAQGQLHADGELAVAYPDGFGVYALNGVRVPAALALTPAESLSAKQMILQESNAEVRREAVRKMGIERVCQQLKAKTIDRVDHYELLLLDVGRGDPRPYLKMKNPSIGVYHIEGVAPGIKTVQAALNWRNHLDENQIDEINGADFFQQGDVLIKPKNAHFLKSTPKILT